MRKIAIDLPPAAKGVEVVNTRREAADSLVDPLRFSPLRQLLVGEVRKEGWAEAAEPSLRIADRP